MRSAEEIEADRKAIAALEIERKKHLYREYPSRETRLCYQRARVRLGHSSNAVGSLDWSRISKKTTFIWKFETLAECATWMIRESFTAMNKHPMTERSQIALHYASRAFGIMQSDLLGDQRSPVLVMARRLAMVCVRRAGVGRNDTARRFHKDQTVIKQAELKVAHNFEGINFYDHAPALGNLGPASDGQSSGSLPA